MKKIASVLFATLLLTGNIASFAENTGETTAVESPKGKICFKIKNDTGKSQTLHTGSGTRVINNLSSEDICIDEGGKLYLAERGNKGKVLLEVKSSVNGKTYELSKLM